MTKEEKRRKQQQAARERYKRKEIGLFDGCTEKQKAYLAEMKAKPDSYFGVE